MSKTVRLYPLPTKDPISGEELIVTRLESPVSGIMIEGAFSLGWLAKLSTEQLAFVGLFLKHRGNLQKLAPELGVSYNTARNRLEEIAAALGASEEDKPDRLSILQQLRDGKLSFDDALDSLNK
ncbi:MAG: DUF2089 domain-containing protein [Trueperaceae bacterium]|nr:DUF2089 domain-containing protein [Trueperaceae bacterium]